MTATEQDTKTQRHGDTGTRLVYAVAYYSARPSHALQARPSDLGARHAPEILDNAGPCSGCPGGCFQCPAFLIEKGQGSLVQSTRRVEKQHKEAAAATAARGKEAPPNFATAGVADQDPERWDGLS